MHQKVPKFLLRLYQILQKGSHADVFAWSQDGLAFSIGQPQLFADKMLIHLFKHNNYSSFIRLLNMYEFRKIPTSDDQTIYRHPYFQKDSPSLLIKVKRRTKPSKDYNIELRLQQMMRRCSQMQHRNQLILRENLECRLLLNKVEGSQLAIQDQHSLTD